MVPSTGFEPVNLYGADLESDAFGRSATTAVFPPSGGLYFSLWESGDLCPLADGVESVLVLGHDGAGDLHKLREAA